MNADDLAQIYGQLEKLVSSQQQLQRDLALWESVQSELLLSNRRLESGIKRLEEGQERLVRTSIPEHGSTVRNEGDLCVHTWQSNQAVQKWNPDQTSVEAIPYQSEKIKPTSSIGKADCAVQDEESLPRPCRTLQAQMVHCTGFPELKGSHSGNIQDSSHKLKRSYASKSYGTRIAPRISIAAVARAKKSKTTDAKSRCVISESNPLLMLFNILCVLTIFVGAWADTLGLAQDWESTGEFGPLGRPWEWLALVVFTSDIFLSMNTSYENRVGTIVMSQPAVIKNYLTTWFLIDVVSTFPWSLVSSSLGEVRLLKFTKGLKAFRVVKVLKTVTKREASMKVQERIDGMFARWFTDGENQQLLLVAIRCFKSSFKFLVLLLLEVHLFTCILLVYSTGGSLSWEYDSIPAKDLDPWFRYFAVMRWTIAAVFAGISTHAPLSLIETGVDPQMLQCCMILCSAANFMFGLAIFSHSKGSDDSDAEFQLRALQLFLRAHPNVSYYTRQSVISFFWAQKRMRTRLSLYEKLAQLPSTLRAPVAIDMHWELVNKVELLSQGPFEDNMQFFTSICQLLTPQFYLEYEPVVLEGVAFEAMYFLISGSLTEDRGEKKRFAELSFKVTCVENAIVFGSQSLFAPASSRWQLADVSLLTTENSELLTLTRASFDKTIKKVHTWSLFIQFVRNLVSDGRINHSSLVDVGLAPEFLQEFQELCEEKLEDGDNVSSEQLGVSCAYLLYEFARDVESQIKELASPKSFSDLRSLFWPKDSDQVGFLGSGTCSCPRDNLQGCAIVDALPAKSKARATHFVSWCWRYTIETVVSAFELWAQSSGNDPSDVFLWMCFFCNNQRQMLNGEKNANLMEVFAGRLTQIGHMIILLDDTTNSIYTSRVWCIFESYKAIEAGIPMTVALPAQVKNEFEKKLTGGHFTEIALSLTSINAEQASASFPDDERMIKNLIRDSIGFTAVNESVKAALTRWLAFAFEDCLMKSSLSSVTRHIFHLLRDEARISLHAFSGIGNELQLDTFLSSAKKYPEVISYMGLDNEELEIVGKSFRRARDLDDYLKKHGKSDVGVFFQWLRYAENPKLERMRDMMEAELQANVADLEREVGEMKIVLGSLCHSPSHSANAADVQIEFLGKNDALTKLSHAPGYASLQGSSNRILLEKL